MGKKIVIVSRRAGPTVSVDVAPDKPLNKMRWLRGKPRSVPIISRVSEI